MYNQIPVITYKDVDPEKQETLWNESMEERLDELWKASDDPDFLRNFLDGDWDNAK